MGVPTRAKAFYCGPESREGTKRRLGLRSCVFLSDWTRAKEDWRKRRRWWLHPPMDRRRSCLTRQTSSWPQAQSPRLSLGILSLSTRKSSSPLQVRSRQAPYKCKRHDPVSPSLFKATNKRELLLLVVPQIFAYAHLCVWGLQQRADRSGVDISWGVFYFRKDGARTRFRSRD